MAELTQYQAIAIVNARTRAGIHLKPFECLTRFRIEDTRMIVVRKVVSYIDMARCERVRDVKYVMQVWDKHGMFWYASEPIEVQVDESVDHMKYGSS